MFLARGYAGTTIDEIARVAGVSRASFYTYFPSKRDVLVAVGAHSASEARAAVQQLDELEPSLEALTGWVRQYLDLLELHGAFAVAWTQAAQEDEEIRAAGMRGHLEVCRAMGEALGALVGVEVEDPVPLGLCALSAIERAWSYCHLYQSGLDRPAVERRLAQAVWGSVQPVPPPSRPGPRTGRQARGSTSPA